MPATDGSWAIDLYLGGDIGTRHEILIGTLGAESSDQLLSFLRANPDQPLSELPVDLITEARFSVEIGSQ